MTPEQEITVLLDAVNLRSTRWRFDASSGAFIEPDNLPPPPPLLADASVIGTDESEFALTRADHGAMTAIQIEEALGRSALAPQQRRIEVHGDLAWAVELLIFVRERRPTTLLRQTTILRRVDGIWQIAHNHCSAGVPNEELWGYRMTTTLEQLGDMAARRQVSGPANRTMQTRTVVFTDIVASTDHLVRIGDDGWIEVVRWHNWKVRELVLRHGGNEVKGQGDGFMLSFLDVGHALDCLLDLQVEFSRHDALWNPRQLRVRIGAHVGPVIPDRGDLHGETVVKAARIAASATAGEALVSATLATSAPTFDFKNPRTLRLKGFTEAETVYALVGRTRE